MIRTIDKIRMQDNLVNLENLVNPVKTFDQFLPGRMRAPFLEFRAKVHDSH